MRWSIVLQAAGRAFALTALVLASACHPVSSTTGRPTPTRPSPSASTVRPKETVPASPAAAAAELARNAVDPSVGAQAVMEILTRSGIPVISAADGRLLNHPATPVLADAYVYDFEVPLLAGAIRSDRSWFLEDVFDLPAELLSSLGRPDLDRQALAEGLSAWERSAFANPDAPGAFLPLVVRELSLVHPRPENIFTNVDPNSFRIDPLQFVLLSASLASGTSTVAPAVSCGGHPAPRTSPLSPAPTDMLLSRALGSQGQAIRLAILEHGLQPAQADITATFALIGGIDVSVADNAQGRFFGPSAHSSTGHPPYRFTAAISFRSAQAGQTIRCGGLAGVRLPAAGPISGWTVSWVLQQSSPAFVAPANPSQAAKLLGHTSSSKAPDEGSTDGGEATGPGGTSTLTVRVLPRPVNGLARTGSVTALAVIDPFRTEGSVSVPSLLPAFRSDTLEFQGLAQRWLKAAVAEIGFPVAGDSVIVSR